MFWRFNDYFLYFFLFHDLLIKFNVEKDRYEILINKFMDKKRTSADGINKEFTELLHRLLQNIPVSCRGLQGPFALIYPWICATHRAYRLL